MKRTGFSQCLEAGLLPLTSVDKRENFMLNVARAQIKLTKATLQNRARAAIVLLHWTWTDRRIGTRMAKKFHVHTCMFTGKATVLSGRFRRPLGNSQISQIFSPHLRRSWPSAM